MQISVFGLGYVGIVTSACLAKMGHKITGVDIIDYKLKTINEGSCPIEEKNLPQLMHQQWMKGRITATKNVKEAITNTDISFVCVGTPPLANGDMDFSAIEKTCIAIGEALKLKLKPHVVVIRSTMFPGSFEKVKEIIEKTSGKKCNLLTNPEFLREGTAIEDFFNPSTIIIGAEKDNQKTAKEVLKLFKAIDTNKWIVSVNIAQMIKYINNSWHANKVCFANEIGAICNSMELDSKQIMNLFFDEELNLSPYYMSPGFAYGGSCLPKDLAMLKNNAKKRNVDCPLLNSISKSNLAHIERAINLIDSLGKKKIGILGISFKANTNDLRGNPILYVINRLVSDGYNVKLFDPILGKEDANLINQSYRNEIFDLINMENLKDKVNDIAKLFTTEKELLKQDVIIVANRDKSYKKCLSKLSSKQIFIDLQNIYTAKDTKAVYRRIV